jgi:hypothetical protein
MNIARIIVWGAVAWLLVVGLLLLHVWPNLPHSQKQWLLFVALGPPLYVLGESVGAWIFSERHGRAISSRGFSIARILMALFVVTAVVGLCWWLTWLLTS